MESNFMPQCANALNVDLDFVSTFEHSGIFYAHSDS
jgi:hypothetical protein